LLIDDSLANAEAFQAHGGQALLVPRPWNPLHRVDTRSYLEGFFKEIETTPKGFHSGITTSL
jgi:hypothetical protein